jgi:hypothetical protein
MVCTAEVRFHHIVPFGTLDISDHDRYMIEMNAFKLSRYKRFTLIFISYTCLLFLSFYRNQWKTADQAWFENFQRDTEGLIMGRLVKSRQDGIFSDSGLPGMGIGLSAEGQYGAYLHNESFSGYEPYRSQIGLQGISFSIIDHISPFDPTDNLRIYRGITALLTAAALSAIMLWFYSQFGLFTALVVFITTLLSQWLTVFGRNLWWSTWAFYLPMIICLYYLAHEEKTGKQSDILLTLFVSIGIFIKTLFNGYEYITTTLVMMVVPLIYYAIENTWRFRAVIKRFFIVILGAITSILISLTILSYQLSYFEGSLGGGFQHLIYTLGKRTYGDPNLYPEIYQKSLNADLFSVVTKYFNGTMIELNNFFHIDRQWIVDAFSIKFRDVIFFFLIATLIAIVIKKIRKRKIETERKLMALTGATWFAILAPLSWFIIFKSHSYIHGHMNYITWHMPFTLFGFALIGFVTKQAFSRSVKLKPYDIQV